LKYWLKRNQSNAYPIKLLKLVSERVNQIAANPYIYKLTDFNNVRVATLGNFSMFFKISERDIIIMLFWDNRQDPKQLEMMLDRP
jgi:hypothetical protein